MHSGLCFVSVCGLCAVLALIHPMTSHSQKVPPLPMPGSLGVVAGVEGSLQDAGREDDPVLGGQVVGVHGLRGHAPPGAGGGTGDRQGCVPSPPCPGTLLCHVPLQVPCAALPRAGTAAPHPMTKGPCSGDQPELQQVTYNTVLSHGWTFVTVKQCHPSHAGDSAVTPARCHILCPP